MDSRAWLKKKLSNKEILNSKQCLKFVFVFDP